MKQSQNGSFFVGLIVGVVLGLGAALALAVYVTKVPVPFLNKSQSRSPDQDAAESRKNQNWDPNAPLYGKNPARPLPAASGVLTPASGVAESPVVTVPQAPASKPASSDPLGDLAAARAAAGSGDGFQYFVQAGAFRAVEEAEAQRAKLSLMGMEAKVTEREQAGRQVFRVRIGPFDKKDDADRQREKLEAGGFETALVRVQRSP